MELKEKVSLKNAYISAVNECKIERSVLRDLHQINDNTLDKWLYVPDRYPSFLAAYQLWVYLSGTKPKIPDLINDFFIKTNEKIFSFMTPRQIQLLRGKKGSHQISRRNYYKYKEAKVTLGDIYQEMGYASAGSLYSFLYQKGIKPGDDITNFKSSLHRAATYLLNGDLVKVSEAFLALGFSSPRALTAKITRLGIKNGDDISQLRNSRRTCLTEKYLHL